MAARPRLQKGMHDFMIQYGFKPFSPDEKEDAERLLESMKGDDQEEHEQAGEAEAGRGERGPARPLADGGHTSLLKQAPVHPVLRLFYGTGMRIQKATTVPRYRQDRIMHQLHICSLPPMLLWPTSPGHTGVLGKVNSCCFSSS